MKNITYKKILKSYFFASFCLIFLIFMKGGYAQNTTLASGDWNNPTNWSAGTVPLGGEAVVIAATHSITFSGLGTCFNLTVNGTLTLGTFNFTVNGTTTINNGGILQDGSGANTNLFVGAVIVNNGGTFQNTGGSNTWNFQNNITNSGTFNISSGGVNNFMNNMTITANANTTFTNGITTVSTGININTVHGGGNLGFGSLSVQSGATFTNNITGLNAFNVSNITNTGNFVNASNAVLRITGTVAPSISNFDCTANGNLVYYDTGTNQNITSTTYHNLTLGNMATKTLAGNITVNGELLVSAVTTFNTSTFVVTSLGDITINGPLSGNRDFVMQGGANTILSAGTLTFGNLTINKSNIASEFRLSSAITVSNTLTLTRGRIRLVAGGSLTMNIGTNLIPVTPTADSYIISDGNNFTRNALPIGNHAFPVSNSFSGGFKMVWVDIISGGNVSVRCNNTITPAFPSDAFNTSAGTWTITSPDANNIIFVNPCPNMSLQPTIYRNNAGWNPLMTNYNLNDASVLSQSGLSATNFTLFNTLLPPSVRAVTNRSLTGLTPNFTSVVGADSYDLQYSTDSTFVSGVTTLNNAVSGANLATSLANNTIYYYRLRSYNAGEAVYSSYSPFKMFSTIQKVGSGEALRNTSGNNIMMDSSDEFVNFFDMTVEMWVKTPTTGSGVITLAQKTNGSTDGWRLEYDIGNRKFRFSVSNGSGFFTAQEAGVGNVRQGEWYHVAGVYNSVSSRAFIYQNGIMKANVNTSASLYSLFPLQIIGNNIAVDEFRIWNVAVSDIDLQNYMCKIMNTSHPNFNSLLTYLQFDEGTQTGTYKFIENRGVQARKDAVYASGVTSQLSGAAIGELSVSNYAGASSLTLTDVDNFVISDFKNANPGVHIYKVNKSPNIITPLPTNYAAILNSRYFGVFFAEGTWPTALQPPTCDITYTYATNTQVTKPNILRFSSRTNQENAWGQGGGVVNRLQGKIIRQDITAGEYVLSERNAINSNARNGGKMLYFNGTTQYAQAGNPLVGDDFTIEFWVKMPTNTPLGTNWTNGRKLVTFENPSSNKSDFGISIINNAGNNRFAFGTRDASGVPVTIQSINNVAADAWNHVAVTRNRTSGLIQIYINGIFNNSATGATGTLPAHTLINIAQNATGSPNWQGYIDELRMWNTIVSANTIRDMMNLRANDQHPNFQNLVSYYRFDEGTGNFSEDLDSGVDMNLFNVTGSTWANADQPLGDGAAQRLSVTTSNSVQNFVNAGVQITFGNSTVPNGDVVVTRLDTAPETYPNALPNMNFLSCYWVIRNYGTNSTFSTLNEMKFEVPANDIISNADLTNPSNIKLYKRPDNAVGNTWGTHVASATGFGSIKFAGPPTGSGNVITEFSQFIIGSQSSPLSVGWVSFEGQRVNQNQVMLRWVTATENRNMGFEIQRSMDGITFVTIGFKDGAGNSSQVRRYDFIDENANQSYYYRLKQVDIDAVYEYSRVIFIKEAIEEESFVLYPNPTTERVQLQTKTEWANVTNLRLVVSGADGKVLWQGGGKLLDIQEGLNIWLKSTKSGVYILTLTTPQKVLHSKLIKQDK